MAKSNGKTSTPTSPTFEDVTPQTALANSKAFVKLLFECNNTENLLKFLETHKIDLEYRYKTHHNETRSLFYVAAVYAKNPTITNMLMDLGVRISNNAVKELYLVEIKAKETCKLADAAYATTILDLVFNKNMSVFSDSPKITNADSKTTDIAIYKLLYAQLVDEIIKLPQLNFKKFNMIPIESFDQISLCNAMSEALYKLNLQNNNAALELLKDKISKIAPGKNLLLYSIKNTLDMSIKREILLNMVDDYKYDSETLDVQWLDKIEAKLIGTIHNISTSSYQFYKQLVKSHQFKNADLFFDQKTISFYEQNPQYKQSGTFLKHITEQQLLTVLQTKYYADITQLLYKSDLNIKFLTKLVSALYEHEIHIRESFAQSGNEAQSDMSEVDKSHTAMLAEREMDHCETMPTENANTNLSGNLPIYHA